MYFTDTTDTLLDSLQQELPQSLLLIGEQGVALERAVQRIVPSHALVVTPNTTKASPVIAVETIRSLYDQTKSRYTDRRVVVIAQADTMTSSAQAAFLKLLEEPGVNVHFVLSSHHPDRLLSTVRSRVQTHTIAPLSSEASRDFIRQKGVSDSQKVTQLLYLASGRPAELERLIDDETYFAESAALVKDARALLQTNPYEQLLIAHRYKDDRQKALRLVDLTTELVRKSLSAQPQHALIVQLEHLLELRLAIAANANIRLAIMRHML